MLHVKDSEILLKEHNLSTMTAIDMTRIYGNKTYKGKWVAIKDFESKPVVVAYGETLKEATDKAQQKGFKMPAIMQIPKKVLPFVGSPRITVTVY